MYSKYVDLNFFFPTEIIGEINNIFIWHWLVNTVLDFNKNVFFQVTTIGQQIGCIPCMSTTRILSQAPKRYSEPCQEQFHVRVRNKFRALLYFSPQKTKICFLLHIKLGYLNSCDPQEH